MTRNTGKDTGSNQDILQLQSKVFLRKTKMKIHKVNIRPTAMYATEATVLAQKEVNALSKRR